MPAQNAPRFNSPLHGARSWPPRQARTTNRQAPMAKRTLGHPTASGVQDTTGINPYLPGTGWDVLFTPDVIGSQLTEIEVYHIGLDGPVGSSAAVLIDGFLWDVVNQGWANGWDP